MTAVGRVRLARGYFAGRDERLPADGVLGVDGYLSVAASRMAVLAGVRQSFARAEQLLAELSGWELDDEVIRQATHRAAKQARQGRPGRGDAARFAEAEGHVEVPIDAGKVNTTEGWRDVKLAVFAKRQEGEAATPQQWDERELPPPAARAVVAGVEEASAFAARLRAEADRLGVTEAADVTVLGDGAEWVWNLAAEVVPQAAGVLDVYHALEHVADATRAVFGDGTPDAQARLDQGRQALLAGGKAGIEAWIGQAFEAAPAGVATEALLVLAAYLAKHPTRLGYAARLARGRSIGSGLVEGSVKQLINLRMKRTGARWLVEHVAPLVELTALADSPEWPHYWAAADPHLATAG